MKVTNSLLPAEKFGNISTPFYYYDMQVLEKTLDTAVSESSKYGFKLHYAVKANANPFIMSLISSKGIGADCVSWNEVARALETGFTAKKIVFAGVGKSDSEINNALDAEIFCFNAESLQELEVINTLALKKKKRPFVALRINPFIDAHTHHNITTGIEESKFGISMPEIERSKSVLKKFGNIEIIGLHFHIGSQITRMQVFRNLCARINEISDWFSSEGHKLKVINVGGGLGVNYNSPSELPPFEEYFRIFNEGLKLFPGQEVHFEPGRALTAQCGSLISRVLYVKDGENTKFVILDAGMTDLIRPALYQAFHIIENLTSSGRHFKYDIAGPVCESTDFFGKYIDLPETRRGDLIAIRSAGSYGEAMASRYNLRDLPGTVFSNQP
jgi:diaminopimelate decarboxylase